MNKIYACMMVDPQDAEDSTFEGFVTASTPIEALEKFATNLDLGRPIDEVIEETDAFHLVVEELKTPLMLQLEEILKGKLS